MSSFSMSLSTFVSSQVKNKDQKNWADLPSDLTSSILFRLNVAEILDSAQKVCKPWRQICRNPLMWRKIDMRNLKNYDTFKLASMCRQAVDLSQGGLVEIHISNFVSNNLLNYIVDRSRNLRILGLRMCYQRTTNRGLVKAISKLPLLETLEVSHSCFTLHLKGIGLACPQLKTLKLIGCSGPGYRPSRTKFDDDFVALSIARSMPELRHLQLSGNRLTDKGLNAILDGCPHLNHLDLHKCFKLKLVGDLEKRCFQRIKNFRRSK